MSPPIPKRTHHADWAYDPDGDIARSSSDVVMYQIPAGVRSCAPANDREIAVLMVLRENYRDLSGEAFRAGVGSPQWWEDPVKADAHERAQRAWDVYQAASNALGVCLIR